MCPHTPIYVSSYAYICVLILTYMYPQGEQLKKYVARGRFKKAVNTVMAVGKLGAMVKDMKAH